MTKLSSVQDPVTGSNYGGISKTSSGVNASYQEYIDNLMTTVQRPVTGAMGQDQYTPSGGRSPVIGQISTPSLGSTPIYGSGAALFPMAIVDQHEKAKKDAELEYLKQVGDVSMDTLKMESVLKNPWHNQAFNSKFQSAQDAWLDEAASRFGGDYMKGMKSLTMDRDYFEMMKSYEDYANIYNSVFDSAVGILSTDPKEEYVTEATRKAAQSFIHDYENLESLPIDELTRRARTFKKYVSANKIATIAIGGMGERVTEGYVEASNMSTDEKTAYLKKTKKGPSDTELRELYDTTVEAYPWIKEDQVYADLLWSEMKTRADKSYKEALQTIDKDNASETAYMKKNGIQVDKDGKVELVDNTPTAFANYSSGKYSTGVDAIVYPKRDMDGKDVSVTTPVGSSVYLVGRNGKLHYVSLPRSYQMVPKKEYTLSGLGGQEGRHVEGTMYIEEEGLYSQEYTKSFVTEDNDGNKTIGTEPTGGRSAQKMEKVPLRVKDLNTGNMVDLQGSYQIIAPFDDVEDELNISYPFLKRTHADMENTRQTRRIKDGGGTEPTANTKPATNSINVSKEYATGDEAAADQKNWSAGDVIVVGGESYEVKANKKLRKL